MKKPTGRVIKDGEWNTREELLNQLFLEYFSVNTPPWAVDEDEPESFNNNVVPKPDALAEALALFVKGWQ